MKQVEESAYKRIPLEILIEFSEFCETNNLCYSLAYGTLLGSVRHKGYIPWDDDIDVFMPRNDYDRFRKIYNSNKYVLKDLMTDNHYPVGVAKLCDTKTIYYYKKTAKRDFGLFIDIFVLDDIPSDNNVRRKWLKDIRRLLDYNRKRNTCFIHTWMNSKGVKKKVKLIISKMLPISSSHIHRRIDLLLSKYRNCGSGLVGSPVDIRRGDTFLYPKHYFQKYIEKEFEGRMFKVSASYEDILKIIYGDYMTLPPISEQVPKHDLIAYYI